MSDAILAIIAGVGTGALFAALGQGLVTAYKGSGVINFAHGAIASYGAYMFNGLRTDGRLAVPPLPNPLSLVEGVVNWFRPSDGRLDLPDIPTFIDMPGGAVPTLLALLITLVIGAGLGVLLHVLVFRPLRGAPALAKIVATAGVMIVLQQTIVLRFGTEARRVAPVLPNDPVRLPGLGTVALDRILLLVVALLVGTALVFFFRYTRRGRATCAAAESEKGAVLLGYSPQRLAAITWVLASMTAVLIGCLVAPITALTPTNFTIFLIPTFAAVLAARFDSIVIATVCGVALGMLDNLLLFLEEQWSWLPTGTREALPFLIIFVVLYRRGSSIPVRGWLGVGRHPFSPEPAHIIRGVAVSWVLVAPALVFLSFEWRQALMVSLISAIVALSLVVITGFVGQISFAQMTFAGAAAVLFAHAGGTWGLPFPLAPLVAIAGSALIGVLLGIPALRVRGANLAIVTIGFAVAFQGVVLNNDGFEASEPPPPPSMFGVEFGPFSKFPLGDGSLPSPAFGLFVLVIATVLAVAVANLRRSGTGRAMLAVRGNERAAASLGINVVRRKLTVFAIASAIAGTGGVLLTYLNFGTVNSEAYRPLLSVAAFAAAYMGGLASVGGAIVAGSIATSGLVATALEQLVHLGEHELLVSGIGLVVTAVRHPEGIAGVLRHARDAFSHRARREPELVEHDRSSDRVAAASRDDRPPVPTEPSALYPTGSATTADVR